MSKDTMSSRQCEIAAEAYAASLLARTGFDVLVQYGANQPSYDLVAEKSGRFLPISVKGSQDGGWMLAVKYKTSERTYIQAIDAWLEAQRPDVVYFLIQLRGVALHEPPRVHVARPSELAEYMKSQRNGLGYGSLQEDIRRDKPRSQYGHKVPDAWLFSRDRIEAILREHGSIRAR